MYPVSEAFLTAVQENTRRYYWTGRITTKTGVRYEFGPEDIVKGSGTISSQCCGNAEIELGSVYAAELNITLFSKIDRYSLDQAEEELFYHLRVSRSRNLETFAERACGTDPEGSQGETGNGEENSANEYDWTVGEDGIYETIPMGIFEVSEANRKVKSLELKAYDQMLRFEKNFNGFETIGNTFDFMVLCSKACWVELAQSREVIEALPNGTEELSIYPDNDIETYRDVLYYVGQVLGGFFVINRAGRLELRKYGDDPVLTVAREQRFSSSFSDFITRYTAVSSTNIKTQIAEYYALDPDDGLTMNLGVNPLLQFGLEETREELIRNILDDLTAVYYVPFESDTIGNPALDIGDILRFSGGQADGMKYACITKSEIKIGGRQKIVCVGKNPWLARAKSKNDKNISGLISQMEQNAEAAQFGIHTFTNASAYTVADTMVRIISIQFASGQANPVQFFGQVIVDVSAENVSRSAVASGDVTIAAEDIAEAVGTAAAGTVVGDDVTVAVELPVSWKEAGSAVAEFAFQFNDEWVPIHRPMETWKPGKHTILLYCPVESVMADYTNTFNVFMKVTGGTASVDVGGCVASISGQGFDAKAGWDGELEFHDQFTRPEIGGSIVLKSFSESMRVEMKELVQRTYRDTVGRKNIGAFGMIVDVPGSNGGGT